MIPKATLVISLLALLLAMASPEMAVAKNKDYSFSIQFENDFFGGGTDRHFTHGTRMELLTPPIKWITDAADKIPWFSASRAMAEQEEGLKARAAISMGQSIFTPQDKETSSLVADGRPYAGWLYMGFGLVASQGSRRYDKLELEVGMIGPTSFAEEVQTFWHSFLGIAVPRGWDNQLDTEPGAVLYYEQARRFERKSTLMDLKFDLIPHFGGSVGNVFTYGALGLTARIGPHLEDDFGAPRIRPSLPGSSCFRRKTDFNWYIFAGVEGRAVLQNIFLDGNTFTDSHSVDKRPLVGDLQAGIVFRIYGLRFSYTQIFRTKEFYGQESADIYGALNLTYQF